MLLVLFQLDITSKNFVNYLFLNMKINVISNIKYEEQVRSVDPFQDHSDRARLGASETCSNITIGYLFDHSVNYKYSSMELSKGSG